MKLPGKLRQALRFILLGRPKFPGAFDLPLHSPQTEVAVWLHGLGTPRDVTACHSVACPIPFTFCVGFEEEQPEPPSLHQRLSLRFCERTGSKRLLGEIEIQHQHIIFTAGPQLRTYKAIACTNFCISPMRSWMRSKYNALERWNGRGSGRLEPSSLDNRCNEIAFFCPRPVVLVTLLQGKRGNIFPMNLMGYVGTDYFAFALNRSNQAAPAVGALAQLAVSSIPFEQAEQVRQLGKNHHQSSIDWTQLPFTTHLSPRLGIPIPDFALAVRELQVEKMLPLGSHILFIARILSKQIHSSSPEFHRIHGLYAARRADRSTSQEVARG